MKTYTISVQVIKTYWLSVDATDRDVALDAARSMTALQIDDEGEFRGGEVDNHEIVEDEHA